jgi:parvulin-like peptidyl-prolyl isomerase
MNTRTRVLGALTGAALWAVGGGAFAQAPPGPPAPPARAQATDATKPAATVNGEPITIGELDAILRREGPAAVEMPEGKKREMRLSLLGAMIDDVLLQQFLRQNGPKVDPNEVNKRLSEVVEGLKKQGKTLQDFLKESGMTEAQVRADVVNILQWRDYVVSKISDADVKKYYDENKDHFDRVVVRASHIVLRVPATASDGEKQAAVLKLRGLRQEIAAGKLDFAEAAKKHSQCPSAPQGGDIGVFSRKLSMVDEAFAKTAYQMQPGQVSDVVQTEYGYHLIKVTERKPGTPSDFTKQKEEVRELCVWELRQNLLAQMRKAAKIEVLLP